MPDPTSDPRPVCLFDLNGTLLDLSALDPYFARAFGDPGVRALWFRQTLELALTQTAIGSYTSFDRLAAAALDMVAARRGVTVSAADKKDILGGTSTLPAFPDVPEALEVLREAGYRLAVLTNSALPIAQAQVAHAQLSGFFEQVLSADTAGQLKPGPKPYAHAAERLGVAPGHVRLVAAHSWDVAGALAVGMKAAFVARPDQALSPLGPQPEVAGADLLEVARRILGA